MIRIIQKIFEDNFVRRIFSIDVLRNAKRARSDGCDAANSELIPRNRSRGCLFW
jgi:hypothetical protein